MRRSLKGVLLSIVLVAALAFPSVNVSAATTIYDNKTGSEGGYDYELWKDNGTTSMTLNGEGKFSCSWSNIGNALFRKGKKFDSTKTYQQIGNISINYGCDYRPNGNSYLCVYGWTVDPLVEYYVVDSWGTWRPPGGTSKGQITVDGGTYDVYETTRVNQPSIKGNTTFKQYWSVRTQKRTSGTITLTEHFKAWERMGMQCGKLYEAALNVEGYQSSGSANVYTNVFTIGGSVNNNSGSNSNNNNYNNNNNNNNNSNSGSSASSGSGTTTQCESMTLGGQYAGKINSPFSGVALYANNDSVSYTQYFGYDTHDFTLRGCSNNSKMAKVELRIGGESKGTFYYGDSYPAEYTIKNVKHKTGAQKVELIVTSDDGQWDAYVDYLRIGGDTSSNNNSSNNNSNNTNYNNNNSTNNNQPVVNKNSKVIALTFDDGPSSTTSQVLDILERENVVATFFLIGNQVNSSTQAIIQRQIRMGCELGCHSYNHKDMKNMSAYEVKQEFNNTQRAVSNIANYQLKYFRAPYLSTSSTMFQNINVPFIQGYTADDWYSNVNASQRLQKVLANANDGAIILLHDFQGNTQTVDALTQIIRQLKNQGYTFVTVSQLFEAKGVNSNQYGKVWSNVKY